MLNLVLGDDQHHLFEVKHQEEFESSIIWVRLFNSYKGVSNDDISIPDYQISFSLTSSRV